MSAPTISIAEVQAMVEEIDRIANSIRPMLAGKPAEVQGGVLGELVSMYLAGHYQGGQEIMDLVLTSHVDLVRKLTPHNIKLLKERHEH
jgi:hypothetical protein